MNQLQIEQGIADRVGEASKALAELFPHQYFRCSFTNDRKGARIVLPGSVSSADEIAIYDVLNRVLVGNVQHQPYDWCPSPTFVWKPKIEGQ